MSLFGPPDIDKLKNKHDCKGLIKATTYQKDWYVREKALEALAEIGCKDTVLIAKCLADEKSRVRETAIQTLSKIGGENAIPYIVQSLIDDKDSSVQWKAGMALTELGWTPSGSNKASAVFWAVKREYDKCASCGEYAIEPLLSRLVKGEWERGPDTAFATLGESALEQLIEATKAIFAMYLKIASETTRLDFSNNVDRNKSAMIDDIVKRLKLCTVAIGEFGTSQAESYLIPLYQFVKDNVYSHPSGGALDMLSAVKVRSAILSALRSPAYAADSSNTMKLIVDVLQNDPAVFVRWEAIDSLKEFVDQSIDIFRNKEIENALRKALVLEENHLQDQRSQGLYSLSSRKEEILALLAKAETR
jgi:HEAT repeat protein